MSRWRNKFVLLLQNTSYETTALSFVMLIILHFKNSMTRLRIFIKFSKLRIFRKLSKLRIFNKFSKLRIFIKFSNSQNWEYLEVVGIRYSVQVFYFYFQLATLTHSPKCFWLLIIFSLNMLDSPRLVLSLSTW